MPRLAIAQLRPTKGDYNANLQKIGGVLAQIAKLDPPVDLAVFPETATSGYFVEGACETSPSRRGRCSAT